MIKNPQKGDRVKKTTGRVIKTTKKGTISEVFGGPNIPVLGYCKFDVEWDNGETETLFRDEVSPLNEESKCNMISDPEVEDPDEGERVCYIPDHADGIDHEDAEFGWVKRVDPIGILVDFQDRSGVAKLCYRRNLKRLGQSTEYDKYYK